MLFIHFYLLEEKKLKPCLYRQRVGNTLALNSKFFCQQIDKK